MFNIVIIGAGHYVTGQTTLSGKLKTDKDAGVLLPSILYLKSMGLINNVALVATNGDKMLRIKSEWENLVKESGLKGAFDTYPKPGVVDQEAYKSVIRKMPKPCAAIIAVPDHKHSEIIQECIKEGCHIFVVKPAVTNMSDLNKIIRKIDEKPILAMVDYHKVFDEANIVLKDEYLSGVYGKLQHVKSLMTQRRSMLDIYSRWLEKGHLLNVNHYLGSHYIHMTGYITRAAPIDVRATAQYGVAEKMYNLKGVADLIETQVRWKETSGNVFCSYHISGWSDPTETESMTYQEIQLICENGHVDSDQRYRGLKKVLTNQGSIIANPYFFNLKKNPRGILGLESKYGFLSVKNFVKCCLEYEKGNITLKELDALLPTIRESSKVTAILEAADKSIANDSAVIKI